MTAGSQRSFFHSVESASGEEHHALVVVLGSFPDLDILHGMTLEEIIVINEVHLHARCLQRGHFQNQRMVVVVNRDVGA